MCLSPWTHALPAHSTVPLHKFPIANPANGVPPYVYPPPSPRSRPNARYPDNIANSKDPVPADAGVFKHCDCVQFFNGKMFAFGGTNNTDYEYDVSTQQWQALGAWFTPRAHFACAVVHGQIYVVGGQYFNGGSLEILSSVERFDPTQTAAADRRWIPVSSMLSERMGHAVAVLRDEDRRRGGATIHAMYVVGGFDATGANVLASAERYDLTFTKWDEISALGSASEYAIKEDKWVGIAPMHQGRAHPALAVLNGIVYALGGWHPEHGALSSMEVYDPVWDKWEMLTEASWMPAARFNFRVAVASGALWALGGYDHRSSPTSTVFRFEQTGHRMPNSQTWSTPVVEILLQNI